ncbi:MAG: ATP-dependent helicase [Solirubrobacteraceae bacterium]
MSNYLSDLNEVQKEAATYTKGPLMIIAGAGSGKTRVLTYRIAHLMEQGVEPFNILALTFTNKAAKSMKERIGSLISESKSKGLWMGTFHSVFARILRSEAHLLGFPTNFTIYDSQDALNVIKKLTEELQLDKDIYKPKQVLQRISQLKNNLITVKIYFSSNELIEADAMAMKPKMGDLYKAYVERCFKSGAMDFDDLLLRTNEILTRFPEVLVKYQDRFRYILVDEYQDTNHSQYLIVKALAARHENICVVGDDAQSIYAFRGANIRNILNFQQNYPDAKLLKLEQNYRSTKNIVNAANSIIKHNQNQLEKTVWTENEEGQRLMVYNALSDNDEAQFIASTLFEKSVLNNYKYSDFAILYRTNAQSRAIEESLRKRNIPYKVFGGISFYQRKEVKDFLSYLRLLINKNDEEALLRIINYPKRAIGETSIQRLIVGANQKSTTIRNLIDNIAFESVSLGLNKGTAYKLEEFAVMLASFEVFAETHNGYEIADHIAKKSGFLKALREDDSPESASRLENIQELLSSIQGFIEEQIQLDDGDFSLANFLENVALVSDFKDDESEEDKANKVSLMTVHLAKGLEFPIVFIAGLEENLFPSIMSINSRLEIEEERRLFYVAITRAEKEAIISHCSSRFKWGRIDYPEASRFIEELEPKYLNFINPTDKKKNKPILDPTIFGFDDLSTKNNFNNYTSKSNFNKKTEKEVFINPKLKPINSTTLNSAITNDDVLLNVGDSVLHDRFGKGEIIELFKESDAHKALIKFEHSGEKRLLLKFAKLKKL